MANNDHSDIGFVPDSGTPQDHSDIGFKPDPIPTGQKIQDAIQGYGNAATYGTLPALQTVVKGYFGDPDKDINDKLRSQGATISEPEYDDIGKSYQDFQNLRTNTQKNDPDAYNGGQLVAAVPMVGTAGLSAGRGLLSATGGLLKKELTKGLLKYGGPAAASAYSIYKNYMNDK